ncbi:MAG TPA: cyclic nucleotide-binding domain-containing protein [Caldilineaceae bacterium]|nr:cyclic nucleotide-binding domain-containing protein [Caldilineaceae bacterium]
MKNELIKLAPIFAGLTDEERERLAEGFAEGQCAANGVLLKAGERSDAMYMIGQGFVSLTTLTGASLATLGPGSLIGDASLFRNLPQDVTATALSDLQFWKLTDRKLREIIVQQPAIGLKLSRNFGGLLAQMEDYLVRRLAQAPELAGLAPNTLQVVASRLKPRETRAQDVVYRAGDAPAGLFLLESGRVELRSEVEIAGERTQTLAPGAVFGALALLTGKPYVQSAVTPEPAQLWVLTAEDFTAISMQHPGLRRVLARNARARLSKSDQAQAVLRLAQMPLFAEVPPATMQAIAQRMVLQHVPAGERVYMMGEAGDALYLLESGEVELTTENASGVVEELARISGNGFFGEMSLLTGQIRTEDATAIRNTNLWILYKHDLEALAAQYPEIGKALSQGLASRLSTEEIDYSEERFRRFPLLADLSEPELRQVVEYLRPTRYRAGEQIYRATSPANMLYLLEKGHVRIQPLAGGQWLLGPGEAFGERALLTNQPHNASALAETDVDVWTLSKSDFDMLLNRYPSLAINMSRMLSQRLAEMNSAAPTIAAEEGHTYAPRGSMPATNIPARRRHQGMMVDPDMPAPRGRAGFGQWFANLSPLGKIQLAILLLLLIWLLGIAAPTAFLRLLQGASVASGADLTTGSNLLNAINAVYAMGSYELAARDKELAAALALADKAVPPTPTHTPAPTYTPIPTNTPLPTNTPTPQPTPTATAPAPAFVQELIPQAQPTATAEPVAAAAALPPRAWDPRLDQLGVVVEEAQVSPGQQYWRLIEARWADEQESGGKHHIYVEVLDENGNRIVGQPVTVFWGDGSYTAGIEDKAPPDYGYNYMMYAAGNAYNVKVEGLPSDILRGAGMGDIERPKYGIHTSFYLVYQRATK